MWQAASRALPVARSFGGIGQQCRSFRKRVRITSLGELQFMLNKGKSTLFQFFVDVANCFF